MEKYRIGSIYNTERVRLAPFACRRVENEAAGRAAEGLARGACRGYPLVCVYFGLLMMLLFLCYHTFQCELQYAQSC